VPATVYDAQDHDIWPNLADRPPPAMREQIRQVAQDEVTEQDIEGLTFAPWYAKFYVAEGRVRARMDAAKVALPPPPPVPSVDPEELQRLRRRVAKLEQGLLTKGGWFVKAVGQAIGEVHRQIDDRIDALEGRDPVPLPVPDWNTPTVHYCGLWNAKHLYGPGAMVTYNGGGWIAVSAMAAGVKPGNGPTGWRLAIKSDTASVRSIVRDEVRRQLQERT
jgi:hypothetical protein